MATASDDESVSEVEVRTNQLEYLIEKLVNLQVNNVSLRLVEGKEPPKLENVFYLPRWLKEIGRWIEEFQELNENVPVKRVLKYVMPRVGSAIKVNLKGKSEMIKEWKDGVVDDTGVVEIKEVIRQSLVRKLEDDILVRAEYRMSSWNWKKLKQIRSDIKVLRWCSVQDIIILRHLKKCNPSKMEDIITSSNNGSNTLDFVVKKLKSIEKFQGMYGQAKGEERPEKGKTTKKVICFKCEKEGHYSYECGKKPNDPGRNKKGNNNMISKKTEEFMMDMLVNGQKVRALVDTGAASSFIHSKCLGREDWKMVMPSNAKFKAANGKPLSNKGEIKLQVEFKNKEMEQTFYITSSMSYDVIMGLDWLEENGVLIDMKNKTLEYSGTTREGNLNVIMKLEEEYSDIISEELDLEKKIADVSPVSIELEDPSMKPVYIRNYHAGPEARSILEKEVQSMLKSGVVELAPDHQERWNFPVLFVRKKDGTWRICIDFRKLNERTKKVDADIPRIQEILDTLMSYKYFTKIDLLKGYWQIPVEERSRKYLSFTSGNKRYQFRVMPFGITNAPAIFQRIVADICAEVGNAINLIDDIIIYSNDKEEILSYTERMLKKLKSKNLLINKKKLEMTIEEISVFGFKIKNGTLDIDDEKRAILKDMSYPTTQKELDSTLGFCNYFRRLIPRYGEYEGELRKQLKEKKITEEIKKQIEESFSKLKQDLLENPGLNYFRTELRTYIETDASERAIGGVLYQLDECKKRRLINFCSRKLKDTELRYSATEKELMGVYYALKTFTPYLIGMEFTLKTDHKPLVHILEKRESKLSGRWNRRLMSIDEFVFKVEHIAGKENKDADFLSRRINAIRIGLPDLKTLQKNDPEIMKLLNNENFQISNGVVTKSLKNGGVAIVLPRIMQDQALKESHSEAHLGVKKSMERLKKDFYWENMGNDMKSFVENCEICQKFNPGIPKVSASLHIEGESIWSDLALDFMGPFEIVNTKVYILVVIDIFSKFAFARVTLEPTSGNIIVHLRELFCLFGAPKSVLSDNAANLCSEEMELFYSRWEIKHRRSSPYNPQGNSVVERAIQTIKRSFVKLSQTIINPQEAITCVLSAYNNSIHRITKKVPFELVFGRRMKLPIRRILEIENDFNVEESLEREEKEVADNIEASYNYTDMYQAWKKRVEKTVKFEVEERVLVRKEVRENNLTPRYYGPFTIMKKIGPNVYKLKENGKLVSARRLKKFRYRDTLVDLDWSGIIMDEEMEEDEEADAMISRSKQELLMVVDRFYNGGTIDEAIRNLKHFGEVGHHILLKLIREKPREKVMKKIASLEAEDLI